MIFITAPNTICQVQGCELAQPNGAISVVFRIRRGAARKPAFAVAIVLPDLKRRGAWRLIVAARDRESGAFTTDSSTGSSLIVHNVRIVAADSKLFHGIPR